jgi:hypothetical protein
MRKLITLCTILAICACMVAKAQTTDNNNKTTQSKETKVVTTQPANAGTATDAVQPDGQAVKTRQQYNGILKTQSDPVQEKQRQEKLEWIRTNNPELYKELMEQKTEREKAKPRK